MLGIYVCSWWELMFAVVGGIDAFVVVGGF
jgi:hypothetical protein